MPKLTASKEDIKGFPVLPEGMFQVRLDGFEPKLSKGRDSVNLRPVLKVVNHPEYNDQRVFENLSTKAQFYWKDFCHAFGVPCPEDSQGGIEFPGDFAGPEDITECEKWQYVGPLLGQIAQLYLIQQDDTKGGVRNGIKFYVCRLPGCNEKHSNNLAK